MGLLLKFLVTTTAFGLAGYGLKLAGEGFLWGSLAGLLYWQVIFRLKNGYWFDP